MKTLAAGLAGKSFIASAYAATAPAFAIIPGVLNSYSPNFFILSNGSSTVNKPAIAPPTALTAPPMPDTASAAPNAAIALLYATIALALFVTCASLIVYFWNSIS